MTSTDLPPTDLDLDALAAHLARRGLVADPAQVQITALPGGVSNDVLAVRAPGLDAVVKRALGQLRVAETWLADPGRIDTEGRALQLAGRLVPGASPRVLDLADGYLVIERAPDPWLPWKTELLAGTVRIPVAERLGHLLGTWQRATSSDADVAADFGDQTAFTQLRVDPFHRTIAARHPDLAGPVNRTVDLMAATRTCLVHGDYTPKNVLADPDGPGVWVIDWEVAHYGDPTFDPAWTVGHLLLKSVHQPDTAAACRAAGAAFLAALTEALDGAHPVDAEQLIRQTGCLLVARVDGLSPVEYLSASGRRRVRNLGRSILTDPPATVLDAWEALS